MLAVRRRRTTRCSSTAATLAVTPVALPRPYAVLVVHSGVAADARRQRVRRAARGVRSGRGARSASPRCATRRSTRSADDPIARHVVTENQRVLDFVAALDDRRHQPRSARSCSPATRACATTTRSRPRSSTCSSSCSSSTARSARGSPAPGSAAASSRSCSATTPTTARRKTVAAYRERTGLEPQAFVVRAVDGAGPVDPELGRRRMKLTPADRSAPGPAPVAETSDFARGRAAASRSTGPQRRAGTDAAAGQRPDRRRARRPVGAAGRRRTSGARSSCPTTSATTRSSPPTSGRCGTGGSSPTPASTRPRAARTVARLCFAAVDYLADVWLNDEPLGHHEGYFAPFGFDVTDRLQKNNEVVVRVQDPLEPLDPDAFFFAHKKRIIKGTLKYHDSRPGGLPGRMAHPIAGDDSPRVWTPEWGQSMTTAGHRRPGHARRAPATSRSTRAFVTPLDHETGTVAGRGRAHEPRATSRSTSTVHLEVGDDHAALDVHRPAGRRPGRRGHRARRARTVGAGALARTARPALHELVAVAAVVDGRVTDRRTVTFGLRTARVVTDDDGHAAAPRGERPARVREGRQLHPVAALRRGRPRVLRPRHAADRRGARQLGRRARARAVAARLRRRRRRRGPRVPGLPAAVVLRQRHRDQPGLRRGGAAPDRGHGVPAARAPERRLLRVPQRAAAPCSSRPSRRTTPRSATSASATSTPRCSRRCGRSTTRATCTRRRASATTSTPTWARSNGGNLYRVSEQPAWFVSEYGFWTVGPQADEVRRPRLAADRRRRCASG